MALEHKQLEKIHRALVRGFSTLVVLQVVLALVFFLGG